MTAAAVAASQGLKVLLVEKTEHVGGTTAWSGGMVWVPANHQMRSAGLSDDVSLAEAYLDSTVPEADGADLRKTFLARGPEAIDYLEAHTKVRLQPVKVYPDYYPELPGATAGGRVLEPIAFDGLKLGHNFERLRPPLPEFTLFGGMMVNRLDIPHLRQAGRSLRSTLRTLRLICQYSLQRLRAPRGTTLHLGNALAARLYASLFSRNVEIIFSATITRLIIENGKVSGAEIASSSWSKSIAARKGVVLGTGGFSTMLSCDGNCFLSRPDLFLQPVVGAPEMVCAWRGRMEPHLQLMLLIPLIGCRRRCSSGTTAAREYSRTRSPIVPSRASSPSTGPAVAS